MKTIAYIITFNSQNINQNICQQSSRSVAEESGCLGLQLKIGVTCKSKYWYETNSIWMSSTEIANTGWPKLPLDDLESLRHLLVELHGIQVTYCMKYVPYKYMQFSVATLVTHAATIWL